MSVFMGKSIFGPDLSSEHSKERARLTDPARGERDYKAPLADPREFLARPFQMLEVRGLATAPDMGLLRWLPTLKDEIGMVLQEPNWYVIKGSRVGIPSWIMPSNSDVLLHSHPSDKRDKEGEGSIPSLGDILNGSPASTNLIVSSFGITQYWPVEDRAGRRAIEAEMFAFHQRFLRRGSMTRYLQFLRDVGARHEFHPWEQVDEPGLGGMLKPPGIRS